MKQQSIKRSIRMIVITAVLSLALVLSCFTAFAEGDSIPGATACPIPDPCAFFQGRLHPIAINTCLDGRGTRIYEYSLYNGENAFAEYCDYLLSGGFNLRLEKEEIKDGNYGWHDRYYVYTGTGNVQTITRENKEIADYHVSVCIHRGRDQHIFVYLAIGGGFELTDTGVTSGNTEFTECYLGETNQRTYMGDNTQPGPEPDSQGEVTFDPCPNCNGRGKRPCRVCDGDGYIDVYVSSSNMSGERTPSGYVSKPCTNSRCVGGMVPCDYCNGTGKKR